MTLKNKMLAFLLGTVIASAPMFASAVDTWHLAINRGDTETNYNLDDPATGEMHILSFDIHTGYYQWLNPNLFKSYILEPDGYVSTTSLAAATSTLVATETSLQSQINLLSSNDSSFNVSAFMANQASTSLLVATSTFNGFMSGTMVDKLNTLSTSTPSFATTTRSTTTGTGATGYQISSTRNTFVSYGGKITVTATIGTPSEGYIALEISPTNSASSGSWVQISICGGGQNITLAALLSSIQQSYCNVSGIVPAGYFAKLRAVTISDTPTFTLLSSQEVQL